MGRHTLLEYYNIPEHLFAPLTDIDTLQRSLTVLIQQSAMTYLGHSCHVFAGTQGVTCVFLLSESHLSLHTWPEHHYAALDIFTCGKAAHPEVMEQGLRELLQPGLVLRQQLARGGLELDKLSPEQRKAKVLHTFMANGQDGESLGQVLHQVPILHSSASRYQSITVIEVPGQLGRHPRITWEYQDAYEWALQKATQCSSDAGVRTEASNSSSAPHAPGPAATEYPAAAAEGRRLLVDTAGSSKIAAPSSHIKGGGSPHGSKSTTDCAGYDVVIIDSTDFTFAAASKLHSEAFYAALHALMRPQAALIQIVEIYMRVFEQDFAKMESAMRSAGWQGVGRSSVFVPSYSGEALMLHAVKH
ncbi:hypothetical protein OEZ86_003988 [Tetradesmus obliquus]|nr:hypothetical protein OEZ86_003988 [Tetradesmus obliquus]